MGSRRSYLQTLSVVALYCLVWTIHGEMPEVHGKVNGEVELICSVRPSYSADVSSGSPHVVEWVRQGLDISVLIKFGSHVPRVHPQYEGRVSLVDITNLKLEGLQLDDQGSYECRILFLDKPTKERQNGTWIMLSVIAAPTFTKTPPPVLEGVVGGQLSLVCAAVGNPLPTITWLKDGSVIQIGNNQEKALSLTALSVQSAGQYTCHASNSEGNATLETKVKIKGPPVIIVPPQSTSLNASQDALLHCQAVADPSNMTYVWLKGGDNVYHLESLKSRVKIMVDGTLLVSSLIPEDSGNYTCAPTNGLLTPPTASAILTVMHPAQALPMPRETYLPTGMDGMVSCSTIAQPPLLHVEWSKDGEPLDLSLYPGWTLTPEGHLLMATVNDDAEGLYTCTPFNSYGSMGQSGPTQVILQDPPAFSITPEKQYKHKVGRTLLIPCEGNDDSTVKVNWAKVDLARRVTYSVTPNGSLLLRPLTKDHHGMWECSVSNRVAVVKAFTQIFVLGTSPHVATSLSVSPGVKQANISWEAGFDGGSAQTFSVWVKKISASDNEGKQEWFSVPVPSVSGTTFLVTGLSPATEYQFSLLSHNKVGTGPFSEIVMVQTLDPAPSTGQLEPPSSLSATLGSAGVVLQWSLPQARPQAITGFVLQSRIKQGEWINLDEDISVNRSEIIVPHLHKDSVYELRLLSRCGELLSEPSPSLTVSTMGMGSYPSSSRLLESPEPLLAGILGGVGFMCLALVLLLGIACLISHKRNQRSQKKQNEPPPTIYKLSPSIKISDSGSTDSVLKKSLLPASALYPTTSSTTSSSSSKMDCSSFHNENRHQNQQLLSNHKRSQNQFQCLKSCPVSPSVELITRGPDGRFIIPPYDTLNVQSEKSTKHNHPFTVPKSASFCSEQQGSGNAPFVLSVDLPPCKQSEYNTSRQICDITQHQKGELSDHEGNYDDFLDLSSMCSHSRSSSICHHKRAISPIFPVLPHIRSGLGLPSTTASTLVLQMEHEREKGNLNHCLKLAKEREELAKELQKYRLYRCSKEEIIREKPVSEKRETEDNELFRGYKSHTLPCRHRPSYRESFGLSPSSCLSSSVHWNDFPTMITDRTCCSPSSPPNSFFVNAPNQHPTQSLTGEIPLKYEGADSSSNNRLTPPHLSSTMRHERIQETPQGYDDVLQSTLFKMQTNISCSKVPRQSNPSIHCQINGKRSNLTLDAEPCCKDAEDKFPKPTKQNVGIEMSVDEPVFETCVPEAEKNPLLRHRIASPVQQGCPRKGRYEEMRRSTSFYYQDTSSEPQLRRTVSQGSKLGDSKQQRRAHNARRQNDKEFLTPEAWIDSLRREKHSNSSSFNPDSWHTDNRSSPTGNVPPARVLPPGMYSPMSKPIQKPTVIADQKLRRYVSIFPTPAKCPDEYQGSMKNAAGYFGPAMDSSRSLLSDDNKPHNKQSLQEFEAEVYEEVPDCGSSYSSFASSGRGSMEPANGRLSLCHLSTNTNSSPETVQEDGPSSTVDMHGHQIEKGQRKPSVDENYEWDEADICSQSADHHGLLPSLNRQNAAALCSAPSMTFSTQALTNFSQNSFLEGHQRSRSALPQPDAVLF